MKLATFWLAEASSVTLIEIHAPRVGASWLFQSLKLKVTERSSSRHRDWEKNLLAEIRHAKSLTSVKSLHKTHFYRLLFFFFFFNVMSSSPKRSTFCHCAATLHGYWRVADTGHDEQPDKLKACVALHEANGGHTWCTHLLASSKDLFLSSHSRRLYTIP